MVFRRLGGQAHIIGEICHLIVKWRIVGENPHGVVIDSDALPHRFHGDGTVPIRNDPVQRRYRKLGAKGRVGKIHAVQIRPCLLHRCALPQNPGNQLKGCHIVLSLCQRLIVCIARKIQSRHAKSLFVGGIVIQRIFPRHRCHADDGIMPGQAAHIPEMEREAARRYHHLFPIGHLIVQGSAKIMILRMIRCRSTHC